MNILILENDKKTSHELCNMIKIILSKYNSINIPQNNKIFVFQNKEDALESSILNSIDVFIIDIVLNENDNKSKDNAGLDFARDISSTKKYSKTPIIFSTGYPKYIMKCINEIHCFSYLLKPYSLEDLSIIFDDLIKIYFSEQSTDFICIKTIDRIYVRIIFNKLYYIKSDGRYINYVTTEGTFISRQHTMKALLLLLPDYIKRCHKSYFVNDSHIISIDKINDYLMIDLKNKKGTNFTSIPLSETYKNNFN